LLIPRLKSDLETGANVASVSAFYNNRKSTVSRVRVLAVADFFHDCKMRTRFVRGSGMRDNQGELLGQRSRRDSLRVAAI
jgi:hypothetical protein